MTTDTTKDNKKWRDYTFQFIIVIITGIFGLRAAGEGTRLSISATQTAESRLTFTPAVNASATAIYINAISTQQAFSATQKAFDVTQQSFYTTSTAIANDILAYQPTSTPQTIQQLPVTNLSNIPSFYNIYSYLLFVWFVFALSQPLTRQRLFYTVVTTIFEPIIFRNSEKNRIGLYLYPRYWLENIAIRIEGFYNGLNNNPVLSKPKSLIENRTGQFDTNWFEEVLTFGFFLILLYAGILNIINTLQTLGLFTSKVPQWLTYYWVAILSGSIVSTIVGVWVVASQKKRATFRLRTSLFMGYFLIVSGLGLALVFSLTRYAELGLIRSFFPPYVESFVINVIIPMNIYFALAVINIPAISALNKLSILLIGSVVYAIGIFIAFLLSLLLLLFDVLIRFSLISIQIIFFLTLSPLDIMIRKIYSQLKVSK